MKQRGLAISIVCILLFCGGAVWAGNGTTADSSDHAPKAAKTGQQKIRTLPLPVAPPQGEDFHPQNKGWTLVWSDEFSGAALDPAKWQPEESCWGGGNDERQCYTARPRNVEVVNGLLRLKAYPEDFTGPLYPPEHKDGAGKTATRKFTSGKVRTLGLAGWTYGRFEARMKLPAGQGAWPAFWMMPVESHYGGWAASGEIDIMEAVNLGAACDVCDSGIGENRSSGALHFGGAHPDHKFRMKHATLPGGAHAIDSYHVFAVEWGEGLIHWFVDGRKYFTLTAEDWFTTSKAGEGRPAAPFDKAFYLMLNLAVGGRFSDGQNEMAFDHATFPNELLVDWVRVYQCASDRERGRACMHAEESDTKH